MYPGVKNACKKIMQFCEIREKHKMQQNNRQTKLSESKKAENRQPNKYAIHSIAYILTKNRVVNNA